MRLTDEQTGVLLRGIVKSRVRERDGMSYVETWDIRAMMNRVFGFCGWSLISTSPTTLVYEQETMIGKQKDKPGFKVAYKAELELIVHSPDGDARYAGTAVGEAIMPDFKRGDAHDMAAKSAESGALKRAATNLGDQFGLSLYRGSLEPVVRKIVGFDPDHVKDQDHDDGPGVGERPEDDVEISVEQQVAPNPTAAPEGAGEFPPVSPAPESPSAPAGDGADPPQQSAEAVSAPSSIDEALGPDPGPKPRQAKDPDADVKRRMEEVDAAVKFHGLTNRQKIAVNALAKGQGVKAWTCPADDDELKKVLLLIDEQGKANE